MPEKDRLTSLVGGQETSGRLEMCTLAETSGDVYTGDVYTCRLGRMLHLTLLGFDEFSYEYDIDRNCYLLGAPVRTYVTRINRPSAGLDAWPQPL